MGQKLLLMAKAESIVRQAERGTLSSEVAEALLYEVNNELRDLKRYRPVKLKLELIELLRRWPLLQGLAPQDLASVAMRLHPQPVRKLEVVARQGEYGQSMYFIARGVVRLSKDGQGAEHDIATFMAGDFFGEGALLRGEPYNATATAVTPVSLYRLERGDLDVAIANSPIIREALEKNHDSAKTVITTEDHRDLN
jgi:CPA1 family monovalent cation:H+ antiporter